MQSTKKKLNRIPNVNRYTGRQRTLAILTNKYLDNNITLTNIWKPIIEYDNKVFEFKSSTEKKIKELKECINKQEEILTQLWNIVKRKIKRINDIKKWIITPYKDEEFVDSIPPDLEKAYQYLRPFPNNLIRRWYSTERTQEMLPDWRVIPHAPERELPRSTHEWYNCSKETINYWIWYIRHEDNEYKKQYNTNKTLKNKQLHLWRTPEMIEKNIKDNKEMFIKRMKEARDTLYSIINNPRNPNRKEEWDYNIEQHWVIDTFIWLIYY